MILDIDLDGTRWLSQCTLLCVDTFRRMFDWIEDPDPRVRASLYASTFADPEEERAWRKLMHTDLEHLVLSRKEIVQGDLARLRVDEPGIYSIPLPEAHDTAWLSSLNAARLALFALQGLAQADMDTDLEDVDDDDKQLALVRIHLMAFAQEQIMQGPSRPADDDDAPGDDTGPSG